MRNNRCKNCGGNDFRADRALAGRLICTKCGSPMGTRSLSPKYPGSTYIGQNMSVLGYMIIALIVFLFITNT